MVFIAEEEDKLSYQHPGSGTLPYQHPGSGTLPYQHPGSGTLPYQHPDTLPYQDLGAPRQSAFTKYRYTLET